jgi:hypothetical protein
MFLESKEEGVRQGPRYSPISMYLAVKKGKLLESKEEGVRQGPRYSPISMYLAVKKGKFLESREEGVRRDTRAREKGPITHRAVYNEVTSYTRKFNYRCITGTVLEI